MNPEDRLDLLLDRAQRGESLPRANGSEAEQLVAAQRLRELRQIAVPPAFASQLEARLRQRARALQAEDDPATEILAVPLRPTAPPPSRRRVVTVALSSIIAVVLLTGGIVASSARSLPGDPLYGIKQFGNQVALSQASGPVDRARLSITQLQTDITDLSHEVTDGHSPADVETALGVVISATQQANDTVNGLSPSDQATLQPELQQALTSESAVLRGALPHVAFAERVAFTTQLGVLGDASVPTVTQVSLVRGNGEGLTLIITGTHFAVGAQASVDGRRYPASVNAAGTQLTVSWDDGEDVGHIHTVGVQNPDGTAALAPGAVVPVTPAAGTTPVPATRTPSPGGDDGQHHATPAPGSSPTLRPTGTPDH